MAKRQNATQENQRSLLSEAQQEERQRIYIARLQDIQATCAHFQNFHEQFRELEGERAEKESWELYMQCDSLPQPKEPFQIRTFLSQIRHFEDLEAAGSIDWTLSVDDRSVLTQNIFQKDLTRRVMEKERCKSPGPYFEVNVKKCLEMLRRVDVIMGNEVELEAISQMRRIEIVKVYEEIQEEIKSLFDRLTYRVLAMQKAYMKSVDGIVAMWSHSCDTWRMDLWGLLNVPIIFEHMEIPVMVVQLPATDVQVQVPLSILTDCLTVRCVHTSFDHNSELAKSFEQEVIENDYVSNCGIVDMMKSMMAEWMLQHDIQEEVLLLMQRKREEYEELMQLIAERTEKLAKSARDSTENTEKIVIPKTPKEVLLVPPGMFPEVYDEFISREESDYQSFMENYYHPNLLNMTPDEVNLRENIIVGGVYSLTFVERPGQTQFQHFNIVLHNDGRVLRIIPDVVAGDDKTFHPGISGFTRASRSPNDSVRLEDNELPYFIVTVKLPPNLCKWSYPKVCHFLTEPQRLSKKKIITLERNIIDYRRISSMSKENFNSFLLSTNDNRFASTTKSILRQSKLNEPDGKQITVNDFSLDKALDNSEIRSLETHCLPRIISSFKFPMEFNDELQDSTSPKTKTNRLIKRSDTTDTIDVSMPDDNFDFSVQNHPERVFPNFPKVLPIECNGFDFYSGSCARRSACGVVTTFDKIKNQYLDRPKNILYQMEPQSGKKEKKLEMEKKEMAEMAVGQKAFELDSKSTANKGRASVRMSTVRLSIKKRKKSIVGHVQTRNTVEMAPLEDAMVTHWTTRYIFENNVDLTTNTLTFRTDRLGLFGLAFKRYEQFPFRDWYLQPTDDNPNEVTFSLDTYHVRIFFYITSQGIRGYVTDLSKEYTHNPVKYLEIKEPISDFRVLRKTIVDKNLNIFAENDASFYISNGYFSIKHVASEMHTYNTIAMHSKSMKFQRSSWNRLAQRRDIILDMKVARDSSEFTEVTIRITPEKTTFVNVSEICSDEVDIIKLSYEETWRNVNNYVDLNAAILSMNSPSQEACNKSAMLFFYIKKLLSEIRPLSFA